MKRLVIFCFGVVRYDRTVWQRKGEEKPGTGAMGGIFRKTLMTTRASTLSPHQVINAWKAYLDLLNDTSVPSDQWVVRRVNLLVELLHEMANVLNYEFDKTHIKNSSYYPRGYGELEQDQTDIRLGVKEFSGRIEIPMRITNFPVVKPPTDGGS